MAETAEKPKAKKPAGRKILKARKKGTCACKGKPTPSEFSLKNQHGIEFIGIKCDECYEVLSYTHVPSKPFLAKDGHWKYFYEILDITPSKETECVTIDFAIDKENGQVISVDVKVGKQKVKPLLEKKSNWIGQYAILQFKKKEKDGAPIDPQVAMIKPFNEIIQLFLDLQA